MYGYILETVQYRPMVNRQVGTVPDRSMSVPMTLGDLERGYTRSPGFAGSPYMYCAYARTV